MTSSHPNPEYPKSIPETVFEAQQSPTIILGLQTDVLVLIAEVLTNFDLENHPAVSSIGSFKYLSITTGNQGISLCSGSNLKVSRSPPENASEWFPFGI